MLRRTLLSALPATSWIMRHAGAASARTVTYSWPTNVGPLHPHLYSPNQQFAQAMVYEPLVRCAEGGRIEPALATAWEAERGGRSYLFQLRRGVRFSDGAPFDAAAVVANVEAVLRNRERHAWLELVAQIDGVEALDPATVRLTLRGPYYPALMELALVRPLRFASPGAMRPDGGLAAPVGTGPWRLMESVRGVHDIFARNDAYWGERPEAERVVVRVLADGNSRVLALETGEIDLIHGTDQIDPDSFRRFARDRRFVARLSPPLGTRMIVLNSARPPTDDIAVRLAVAGAVDRAALVRHVLQETEPAAETLFPESLPYCRLGLRAPPFDRPSAAARLEAAGWRLPPGGRVRTKAGKALSLDLCFSGRDAVQKAIAEAVQGDLARIGIAATLIGEDPGSFEGRQRAGEFGMIFNDSWGPPYEPHAFTGSMRAPSHADYQAQRGLPMKAEIDRRITEILASTEEAPRAEAYRWLLTTLHEAAVYFPVSYFTNKAVHRTSFTPVGFGPTRNEIPFQTLRRS